VAESINLTAVAALGRLLRSSTLSVGLGECKAITNRNFREARLSFGSVRNRCVSNLIPQPLCSFVEVLDAKDTQLSETVCLKDGAMHLVAD
jgi:hypothetical protein